MINIPKIIKLNKFEDKRGYFLEYFNHSFIQKKLNIKFFIKQINISNSQKGVLRGLHFQYPKFQSKLIYVLSGKIYDVAVDIRRNSKNFGKIYKFEISAKDNKILYVPKGYAHGFLALNNNTRICYAVDNFRVERNEKTLLWNFNNTKIKWPINFKKSRPLMSIKDMNGLKLNELYLN